MKINPATPFPLVLFASFLRKNVLVTCLDPSLTSETHQRRLTNTGTWWMIANDNGTKINIRAPVPDSLSTGKKEMANVKEYNYEEDKAIVPVILTCGNDDFLTTNATDKHNNITSISMDLELDVTTTQLISEPVTAMLRRLELTMLRKTSEVVCPSTITYAEFPSSRRKARVLQSSFGAINSFKIVDFTSLKFAVESDCVSEQQNGTVCVHVASQLKARITPPIPSEVDTEPVTNMIKNLVGSMMSSGEFDTKRDLGNGVLSVRYSEAAQIGNNIASAPKPIETIEPKSQASLEPTGMNTLGVILLAFTLCGIVYAFFIFVRKKSVEAGIERGLVLDDDLISQCTTKQGNTGRIDQDTKNSESIRLNQENGCSTTELVPERTLIVVAKTNHDAVELEPVEVECPGSKAVGVRGSDIGGEISQQSDWRELLSFVSMSGAGFFGSSTPENRVKKRFLGDKYLEVDLGNGAPAGAPSKSTAETSWRDLAHAIIEQRRVRKEKDEKKAKREISRKIPPSPALPPPPAYTAQELLELAELSHSDTAQVLHRSGPFNSWSPGKTPPSSSKKKPLDKDSKDKYTPAIGIYLSSSEDIPARTISDLTSARK